MARGQRTFGDRHRRGGRTGRAVPAAGAGRLSDRDALTLWSNDPEKWVPVFPRDKRGTRLRGDHAQTKRWSAMKRREFLKAAALPLLMPPALAVSQSKAQAQTIQRVATMIE